MQSRSHLFTLLVVGLSILSGVIYAKFPYKLGLDIQGGARLTYRMKLENATPDQRANLNQAINTTVETFMSRATGSMGVVEPNVFRKGEADIVIELPGFTDLKAAQEVFGTSARIEFYHATNLATQRMPNRPYMDVDSGNPEEPYVAFQRTQGSSDLIEAGTPEYEQILKSWKLILAGEDLAHAASEPTGSGSYQPTMRFSSHGAKEMEKWSRQNSTRGEKLAAVLDGKVLSVAPLAHGAIIRDNAVIQGQFTPQYVTNLSKLLNSGALPFDLERLSSESVDPTIGKTALNQMVTAGLISFGIITLFLIAYYAFPGVIALVALVLYMLFTLAALKGMGATFSLASIAGFILSLGMAVDANILVFERLKEELKSGKSLHTSIQLGFKRALPAIVDSNACTILTALVLIQFGTTQVKGFATTLIIGVLISLFTAITVTRSLLMLLVNSGIGNNPKWFALERSWFGEHLEKTADTRPLQILNKTKLWFTLSLLPIIPGIIFLMLGGLKLNVEFLGGYESTYVITNSQLTGPAIEENLEKNGIAGSNVKFGTMEGRRVAFITTPPSEKLTGENPEAVIAEAAGLAGAENLGFSDIGPSVRKEAVQNAIKAVVISTSLIVLYLALRFGFAIGGFGIGLRFGLSAVGALIHDVLLVLAVSVMVGYFAGWEISALFITAMLTIIGFSVHDTIVIFDRIRENVREPLPGESFENLVNRSITQSFARSINTSATVIATLIIMLIIGTPTLDLKFFSLTMLVGILSGTYSSLYNASPILYLWDRWVERRKGFDHTIMGIARQEMTRTTFAANEFDTPSAPTAGPNGRSYGQVRRRRNSSEGRINMDE